MKEKPRLAAEAWCRRGERKEEPRDEGKKKGSASTWFISFLLYTQTLPSTSLSLFFTPFSLLVPRASREGLCLSGIS